MRRIAYISCILALLLAVALAACIQGRGITNENTDPPPGFTYSTLPHSTVTLTTIDNPDPGGPSAPGTSPAASPTITRADTAKPAASPTYTGTATAPTKGNPDLAIEKSLNGEFHYGQSGFYTILVSNVGSGTASSPIIMVDTLPDGLTFDSYSSPYSSDWASSVSGQQVIFTYTGPDISPGGFCPTLIINVKIAPIGQFPGGSDAVDNYAAVKHPNDGNLSNNQSRVRTVITPAGAAGAR